MKPAWDQLMDEFKDSKTVVIGDVDCTTDKGKSVCSKYGVRGYPTIKYFTGATAADGDKYEGGRDFDSLKKFADENLGPTCGNDNRDLCDEDQLKILDAGAAMSAEERAADIKSKLDAIEAAEQHFKDEVNKLQERYQSLSDEKDKTIADIQPGLRLMRSIKDADASGNKDEL